MCPYKTQYCSILSFARLRILDIIQASGRRVINKLHRSIGTLNCKYTHVGRKFNRNHWTLIFHPETYVLVRALNEHSCNSSWANSKYLCIQVIFITLKNDVQRFIRLPKKLTDLLLGIIEKYIREAADWLKPDGFGGQFQIIIIILSLIVNFHIRHVWLEMD